jgi:DNA repair protein RecO (recombination protein O)
MSTEKATAIVLRVVEWSETSSVVTLFTREFGKLQGLAKGARRPKGPFESALDLLSLCRIVFLRKSSEALDLLTEAKLERRFRPRGRDLASLYAGYYVAELLRGLTDEYDAHPLLFDAAAETLEGLGGERPVPALVLRFEMTLLGVLGHLPSLAICVECGNPVTLEGRVAFGQLAGGVLCQQCRPGKTHVAAVGAEVLKILSIYADRESDAWQSREIDRHTAGELRGLLNHYIAHLLGRRPTMHAYLRILAE